jgi:hypothetical protein
MGRFTSLMERRSREDQCDTQRRSNGTIETLRGEVDQRDFHLAGAPALLPKSHAGWRHKEVAYAVGAQFDILKRLSQASPHARCERVVVAQQLIRRA